MQIVVQVLGKVRGRIDVARDASNEEMQAAAEAAVTKWTEGKTVVKAICVPGKLVNPGGQVSAARKADMQ